MMIRAVRVMFTSVAVFLGAFWITAWGQTHTDLIDTLSRDGQEALAEGRYADAEQDFERLRKLEPRTAEVYGNLGLIYFQERKFELAIPALRQALKLKPSLPAADSMLAMSLSELGRYQEALPGLEKTFQHSSDAQLKRLCGLQLLRAYTGLHQDHKAVEVALEMDRLYPSDPEVLYHNGRVLGNFAYLTMQKLVEVAPSSTWRHQAAGEAQESQGAYADAIGEYRQVLAIDPQRPGIHYRLGRAFLAQLQRTNSPQDAESALEEFKQELKLDPTNSNAAYEIAEIHRKAGRFDEAQKFFRMALGHYPDFEEAHVGLAGALFGLRENDEALVELESAIALNAADEVAWYRLSQVQRALGNVAEQQKALGEYQRLHEKTTAQNGIEPITSMREITKQEVEKDSRQR